MVIISMVKDMASGNDATRVKTGISGLDDLMEGGLPRGSLTLLTGTCGTGKTVFSSQFIFSGAVEFNEPGVYVSFEEPSENIKENMKIFGWDFDKLERDRKVVFVRYDPYHIEDINELIEATIRKIRAQRVVIDSVSALGLYIRDPPELRRMIYNIGLLLRKLNCTSLLTSEILPAQVGLSRFGVEEFIADNVIVLYYLRTDSLYSRAMTIWKMRGTSHSQKLHPYRISETGVTVYSKEEASVKKL